MSITLHQVAEDFRGSLDSIDPDTGEAGEGWIAARDLVEKKALSVVAYIVQNEREADMAEAYIKELQQRIKSQRKRDEWLRQYLAEHMKATGILKIVDERGLFSAKLELERDMSVEVFDAEQVPDDFMREIPAKYEPDKKAIRSALDDGLTVEGARLAYKDRLTIR